MPSQEIVKIVATPEGRPNIFLPTTDSLKAFIASKGLNSIHNFIPNGPVIIGADHPVESVLEDIDAAERLAVFTDKSNMGHSLAVIRNGRLECYDIGSIRMDDLDIQEAV